MTNTPHEELSLCKQCGIVITFHLNAAVFQWLSMY